MERLISADKLSRKSCAFGIRKNCESCGEVKMIPNIPCNEIRLDFLRMIDDQPTVKAIPIERLLNILPKYDDYIHTKTYPNNETMEDIYSKGHEYGWNACLKAIKEELDYWEKENG